MKKRFLSTFLFMVLGFVFSVMLSGPARAGCYDSCHGVMVEGIPFVPLVSAERVVDTALVILAAPDGVLMHNGSIGNAEIDPEGKICKSSEQDCPHAGVGGLSVFSHPQGVTMHNPLNPKLEGDSGSKICKAIEVDDLYSPIPDPPSPGIGFRESKHPLIACLKCGHIGKHLMHGIQLASSQGSNLETVDRTCRLCF